MATPNKPKRTRRKPTKTSHSTVSKKYAKVVKVAPKARGPSKAIKPPQPKAPVVEIVALPSAVQNPITRLSFVESFDPDRFSEASRLSAIEEINGALRSNLADGFDLTVNAISLTRPGVEMTVSASRRGKILFQNGMARIASNRKLPLLVDTRTGRVIEIMKSSPTAKALARLGAISTIAVSAAHIVAGADIAQRLKQVDAKLNLLLAYRQIDQLAKLERIYTSAKELCSGLMGQEKRWELWRLRGELRELRCGWRREMEHHLHLIDDPKESGWFARTFTSQKSIDSDLHRKISEAELQLGLTDYSIRLDLLLAVASESVPEFAGTLDAELIELKRIAKLLSGKASLISKRYPQLSLDGTVRGMNTLVEQFAQILPAALTPPGEEKPVPGAETEQ